MVIPMVISDLGDHLSQLLLLARWHYDQWEQLTGADSFDRYVRLLTQAAATDHGFEREVVTLGGNARRQESAREDTTPRPA
jgi:hypothetical protein